MNSRLPLPLDLDQLADLLQAGSNPFRLQILKRLRERPSNGQELADLLGRGRTTVQRHIDTLVHRGLITFDPDRRQYRISNPELVSRLLGVAPELFPPPPSLPDDV
ncbi:MAG: winged helix-turn-helix domain-containing protein [bacterium]